VDFRDASQRGLNFEPVVIAETARAALEMVAPFAARRSVKVALNFPAGLPRAEPKP